MSFMEETNRSFLRVTELPSRFLDTVIGYDDVKELFKASITSPEQTHILLAGPPASAKTVILLECSKLDNAYYMIGNKVTKAGLVEVLFQYEPSYLLIDEIEKMDREARSVLLGLMDPGVVTDIKAPEARCKRFKTNVYAACNEFDSLIPELLSRFHFKLQFKPYTLEEFIKVGTRVLVTFERKPYDLAEYIVRRVARYSRDIRDTIGIARLARSREHADRLINTQLRYFPFSRSNRFMYFSGRRRSGYRYVSPPENNGS